MRVETNKLAAARKEVRQVLSQDLETGCLKMAKSLAT